MTSYGHHGFGGGYLVEDGYLPQHATSMAFSTPSATSSSLPTSMSYQYSHNNSYQTPRTLEPHPGQLQNFPIHDFSRGEGYAISSISTSARGRSGSENSTTSVEYCIASPRTTPISPHILGTAGSQYTSVHGSSVAFADGTSSTSRQRLPHAQSRQEPPSPHLHQPAAAKSSTEERLYCPHPDCHDERGQPKKSFSRKADVTRHYKSRHDVTYIDCPKLRCERKGKQGFTRRDHLTEHLRGFHMEDVPKRQIVTKTKAKKNASTDDEDPNTSSEENSFSHATINMGTAHSGRPSFTNQASQHYKQQHQSSSDDDGREDFQTDEQYSLASTRGNNTDRRDPKNKVKREQSQPYQRRSSSGRIQKTSPEPSGVKVSPHLTSSPVFTTSPTMLNSPSYTVPQYLASSYTSSHLVSPVYAPHSRPEHYFDVSSMQEPYQGMYLQQGSRYHTTGQHNYMG